MSNKVKAVLIIIVGIILVAIGVFASMLLIQRYRGQQAPGAVQEETIKTDVLVVTRDLFLGDTLKPTDVELISVPVEVAPRNVLTDPEQAVGKIIKTDLVQGEMLLNHNLADPTNKNEDLSFILSEDHVLMAFPASDLMSVEDMVQRGDIIDIFATFEQEIEEEEEEEAVTTAEGEEEEEPEIRTYTLDAMQRIEVTALVLDIIVEEEQPGTNVLGTGGEEQPAEDPQREINIRAYLLALEPQDALILKHLKDTGAIFDIVIRNRTSTVPFELTPVTKEYIIEFYGLDILP